MRSHTLKHTPIAFAALLALGAGQALAQPAPTQLPVQRPGGALINATVGTPAGNALTVTQTPSASNRGLVEWTSFSVGAAARVNITQPNAQSVLVNRVTGSGSTGPSASEIYGAMSANGRVFLVNPSGVLFGPGAQVNVGSLVATSLDLDPSMSANNYERLMSGGDVLLAPGTGGGAGVQVMGALDPQRPQIQVTEGGAIVLVSADRVVQDGVLSASAGHIDMVTAQAARLVPVGGSGFVEVLATLPGSAGSVSLGAQSRTVAEGGSVRIHAGPGGSVTANGGALVDVSNGAAGGTGGSVAVSAGAIRLRDGSTVLADGHGGGGRVDIGDDATRAVNIEQGATVSTDATGNGNGGTIAVRAMYNDTTATTPQARVDFGVTEVYGTLRSRGGLEGGNGGQIETSGRALATHLTDSSTGLTQTATIDARARAAGGAAGTWTLDPLDVTISNRATTGVNGAFNPTASGANVLAADLSAALDAGTNVDISTDAGGAGTEAGNITIENGTRIVRSTGTAATSLTLRANNSILLDNTFIDASAAGPVNVNLFSDIDGNGTGSITVVGGGILTGGGNLTISGGLAPSTGFAQGNAQAPGVNITRTTIDARGSAGAGNVVVRGQAGAGSFAPGVALNADMTVGNLTVDGLANHGTAVTLNGSNITTSAGTISIKGAADHPDAVTSFLIGVDTGAARIQLGTGSLTLAGFVNEGGFSGFGLGLRIGDLQVSASPTSTGTITLAGTSTGNSTGYGVQTDFDTTTGLVISADATAPGSPATGANVVIGGTSSVTSNGIDLLAGTVPNINTNGGVNIRPLFVGSDGSISASDSVPITLVPTDSPAGAGTFIVNTDLLRLPGPNNGGIFAGQGVVIGSESHLGAITVDANAFTQHASAVVTLQNEGFFTGEGTTTSDGIRLGSGNTLGRLGLLTSGSVTQGPGGITVQSLVLRGGLFGDVTLDDAANQIGLLAFDPPANLTVITQSDLTVGAASIGTYNASTGTFAPLSITTSSAGDTALLQSSGNIFINQSISMVGGGAPQLNIVSPGTVTFASGAGLSVGAGQWRVWAPAVTNAVFAGPATNLYGCVFGDTSVCSVSNIALPTTGNQFLHPTQPTVTVAANSTSAFQDLALPNLSFSTTGLVNGDTASTALSGSLGTTATGPTSFAIDLGTLSSPLGYNLVFQPATLTVQPGITRQVIQSAFLARISSDVYGRNLDQPYICTAASVISGSLGEQRVSDPLASEWGKVRNQPQLSGCLNVTDGGQCAAF